MIGKKRKNTAKVKVDLTNYLEKGGYEGTAQDLKNELDNLSTKIEENTLTEVDLVELKKIAKGERFTINYADGEKLSVTAEELKKALKNKEVTEVILNADGLEEYRFQFGVGYFFPQFIGGPGFKDFERNSSYLNSGFYIDIFDKETQTLTARNEISLRSIIVTGFENYNSTQVKVSSKEYFVRIQKYGEFTDYNLFINDIENKSYLMGREETEIIFENSGVVSKNTSSHNNVVAVGKFKKSILTKLYVDNQEVKQAEGFALFPYSFDVDYYRSSFRDNYLNLKNTKNAISKIGDFTYQNIFDEWVNTELPRKTYITLGNNNFQSYKAIQLINTETKEILYENFNVTDFKITIVGVQLPNTLTVKLFTETNS